MPELSTTRNTSHEDPDEFPWDEIKKVETFRSATWRDRILNGLSVYDPVTRKFDPKRREKVVSLLRKHLKVVKSPPDKDPGSPLGRLKLLEAELNHRLIGKQEIVKMVIICAISQQPMLLIGEPGTAKSKIITRFCEGLGIGRLGEAETVETWFQYLLHSFTEPDEILGVVNIPELEAKGVFKRIREGSITEADVIFLDEVFKSNSAILNALLTIINERRVYEGGQARRTKARLIYGASNATPTPRQLEELRAFYERFIIRMQCQFIPLEYDYNAQGNRNELLKQGWRSEVADLRAGYDPVEAAIEPISCLNDILFCNRAATELWGGEDLNSDELSVFLPHYHTLVTKLSRRDEGELISRIDDRKFIRLFLVARAHALYAQRTPGLKDLGVLSHTWDDVNYAPELKDTVEKYIKNPDPLKTQKS